MKFIYEIPASFWGLFRSVNRDIYMEALLTIDDEYQYNNFFLSREACVQILGDMYAAGDMDVRSIITIVLLNGIHDPETVEQKMVPQFRKELQEAYRAGKKYRGKTVKPEKKKKQKKYSAETLNDLR